MKIIACLGNPGRKYIRNRHNIGFMIGVFLSDTHNIPLKKKQFSAETGTGTINGSSICIVMPQTYMNNSGESVRKALDYYNADASDLIVIHDEIELPFGTIKTKFGGGHKGQNGIRSIIQHISSPDFHRIRIGVGRSDNPNISVADHVLSDFTGEEMADIKNMLPEIHDIILSILNQ